MQVLKAFTQFFYLLCFFISGCISLPVAYDRQALVGGIDYTKIVTKPTKPVRSPADVYRCQKHHYPINLEEAKGGQALEIRMVNDHQVELKSWIYEPTRQAIITGKPIPTRPPDGFDKEFLPTTYELYIYDLRMQKLQPVLPQGEALLQNLCHNACQQQLLDQSPNGKWQLISVSNAQNQHSNGIWLVDHRFYQRRIGSFTDNEYYQPSYARWRWRNDASGLFFVYRTAGESSERPLYIRLTTPPAYSFLHESIPWRSGSRYVDSTVVDDRRILLKAYGSIMLDDGGMIAKQWFIYDMPTGLARSVTETDFISMAKYILFDKETDIQLIPWGTDQQRDWLAEHPAQNIWHALGDAALYSEPYSTAAGVIYLPKLLDFGRGPLEIIMCERNES